MGDIKTLLSDPEFQTLSPAGQRALAGRIDPELIGLSDEGFKAFVAKFSNPVTPGMERLGGVPPGPVPIEIQSAPAARMKPGHTPGWDDPVTPMSGFKMAAQFLASPITGLLSAPGQIVDWVKRGGHNPPSGGFLSDEPIGMAYGNALGALGAESANTVKQGAQRVSAVASRIANDRAAQTAAIKILPKGAAINELRNILSPPPPEPTPYAPYRAKPGVAEKWTPSTSEEYGPSRPVTPTGWKLKPLAEPPPPPGAPPPKAPDPFRPNPAILKKTKFSGPFEQEYGPSKPTGPTGWEPPTAPLFPTPPEAPPPQPFQKFEPSSRIKAKYQYNNPSGAGESGMPRSTPAYKQRRAGMPKPPTGGEEAAGEGAVEINGTIITPAMQEALVQAELAKRGLPSKMTPMPNPAAAVTPPPAAATPPPAPGVNIAIKSGRPARYGALQADAASKGGDLYHAKDVRVVDKLQAAKMTKDVWRTLTDEQKNAHIKAVGEREFKGEPKGLSRGAMGMRWIDEMFEER